MTEFESGFNPGIAIPVDPDGSQGSSDRRVGVLRPRDLLAVLLGGAGGTAIRYGVGRALPTASGCWPTATFLVNLVAAFVLGFVVEGLARRGPDTGDRRTARLVLGTGVCGALSTYSAFVVEAALLVHDGHAWLAAGYAGATVFAGLAAAALGITAARSAMRKPAVAGHG